MIQALVTGLHAPVYGFGKPNEVLIDVSFQDEYIKLVIRTNTKQCLWIHKAQFFQANYNQLIQDGYALFDKLREQQSQKTTKQKD